ncbi:TauD/TfdA family dioxygenase [Streptomyces sp. HUAS ZL42]|uniref:TauD/TfdA family dioxygenase n=1 Tax=Streptomyces sp. HUAS ZL42 TaxID=3231715 RepID=UPI00345E12AB
MGVATAPSGPVPESDRTGPGPPHWLRVARETADDLATDAVAREQAAKAPFDEVSRLREAGLLTLPIPAELGGGGADWPTAYAVVREIAAADGAIGQLLSCHHFLSWSVRFFTEPAHTAQIERQSAAHQWCWGGGFARQPLTLTRTAGGYALDGRQSYAAEVLVADRLAVRAVRADTGEPLAVVVDPARHGVGIDGDADTFGQRPAAGGSVEFDGAPVAADDVLGSRSLRGIVVPPYGGNTLIANSAAAYRDLPEPLRELADRLWAVHTNDYDYAAPKSEKAAEHRRRFVSRKYRTAHPVVRVHPETGERGLFVGGFAQSILGLGPSDSRDLLRIFQSYVTRPENIVRVAWTPGDLVLFDNRITQHYAPDDYGDLPRLLHRVTVAGDVPAGVDGRLSHVIEGDDAAHYTPAAA